MGSSDEVAIDSTTLSEAVGMGVTPGVADGPGDDGGLAFCGGLTTVGGGPVIEPFSFSRDSLVGLGKLGVLGCFA